MPDSPARSTGGAATVVGAGADVEEVGGGAGARAVEGAAAGGAVVATRVDAAVVAGDAVPEDEQAVAPATRTSPSATSAPTDPLRHGCCSTALLPRRLV